MPAHHPPLRYTSLKNPVGLEDALSSDQRPLALAAVPRESMSVRLATILSSITLLLLLVLLLILTARPPPPASIPVSCGTTHHSALAAGCLFDPLSFLWTPPACHDAALIASFLELPQAWAWYLTPNDTTEVPLAVVNKGEHEYMWVNREFHLYHCTYMWRKMHRAWLRDEALDGYVARYGHTEHCEGVLVEGVGEGGTREERGGIVDVMIRRKFVGCVSGGEERR